MSTTAASTCRVTRSLYTPSILGPAWPAPADPTPHPCPRRPGLPGTPALGVGRWAAGTWCPSRRYGDDGRGVRRSAHDTGPGDDRERGGGPRPAGRRDPPDPAGAVPSPDREAVRPGVAQVRE